jgi:SAM-dependent methyltransferase
MSVNTIVAVTTSPSGAWRLPVRNSSISSSKASVSPTKKPGTGPGDRRVSVGECGGGDRPAPVPKSVNARHGRPGQDDAVIVVVATTERELAGVTSGLRELGVSPSQVVAPSDARRLVLAPVGDESEGERLLARLRAEGALAVMRPAGGPRLAAWLSHTRPVVIGGRVGVCFVWSEHDRPDVPALVELDPGGGFGTGGHPSTRLLVEELAGRLTGGERVLDIGCGTGVLGLCALRLGASSAVGVDIDPQAIEATRRNAALNGLEGRMEATLAPLGEIEGAFDIVVANIGRAGFVELGPALPGRVSPRGWLAVSGFSPPQCPLVAALLRPLEVVSHRTCDEWSALVLAHGP